MYMDHSTVDMSPEEIKVIEERRSIRRRVPIVKMFNHAKVLLDAVVSSGQLDRSDRAAAWPDAQRALAKVAQLRKQFKQALAVRYRHEHLRGRIDQLSHQDGGESTIVFAASKLLTELNEELTADASSGEALAVSMMVLGALGTRLLREGEEWAPIRDSPCHKEWVDELIAVGGPLPEPEPGLGTWGSQSLFQDSHLNNLKAGNQRDMHRAVASSRVAWKKQ
jgi:hypothetical protein